MNPLTKSIIALIVALAVVIPITYLMPQITTELTIMDSRLLRLFCIVCLASAYIGLAASVYFVVKNAKTGK